MPNQPLVLIPSDSNDNWQTQKTPKPSPGTDILLEKVKKLQYHKNSTLLTSNEPASFVRSRLQHELHSKLSQLAHLDAEITDTCTELEARIEEKVRKERELHLLMQHCKMLEQKCSNVDEEQSLLRMTLGNLHRKVLEQKLLKGWS